LGFGAVMDRQMDDVATRMRGDRCHADRRRRAEAARWLSRSQMN